MKKIEVTDEELDNIIFALEHLTDGHHKRLAPSTERAMSELLDRLKLTTPLQKKKKNNL